MATSGSNLEPRPFDIIGDMQYSLADAPGPVETQETDWTEYLKNEDTPDDRVLPKQPNDLSLYKLMTQKAESGESMLNYAARLRKFAEKCDFRDWSADKMIKCMVLVSMKDEELKMSLLEMDLELEEVLDKVKIKEESTMVSRGNAGSGGYQSINSDSGDVVQKPKAKRKSKKNLSIVKQETHDNGEKDIADDNMMSSIGGPNKCLHCGEMFKDTVELGSHMMSHIGENYPSYDTSVMGFTPEADVVHHIIPHSSDTTIKDEQCSDSTEDFIEDEVQEEDDFTPNPIVSEITNNAKKPHQCFECGKQYPKACSLYRHMRTHTHEKTHPCNDCGKLFREAGILKKHMMIHTGEKPHQCSQCDKKFTQVGALNTHMMIHTGERPHVCSTCGKQFIKASDLKQHMRTHTGEKPHICSFCGKPFTQAGSLRAHLRIHTGEKPYACSACGTTFAQSSSLQKHMMTHTGEKPHQCTKCGKTFRQMGSLKIHMQSHTGEKPHTCCVCTKQFKTRTDLKVHMMIHTGERPHKCPHCSRQFIQIGALKGHIMTHTGERPHQCTECTKSFIKKGELRIHIRTHTGEKPHKCSQCEKQFAQRGNLLSHMRTHTGDKPYQCSTCGLQFAQSSSLKRHRSVHADGK